MYSLYDQYQKAYPELHYDKPEEKQQTYGWRGAGIGWQKDISEWKTDPIYPTLDETDDADDGGDSEDGGGEIMMKAEKVEGVGSYGSFYDTYMLGEKGSGLYSSGEVQDFYKLRDYHYENGTLFEDPTFPADRTSLSYSRKTSYGVTEWLRPSEICNDPKLFVEGFSRFDVQQGALGDCWFLAAVANITLYHNLFFQVVPIDQSFDEKYAGIFHFRFWQYGRWIDVVIDDRLPTAYGELLFLSSTEKNEFWSALLEKAYAKLHGSYEALEGGNTCEAMEDFTGGVSEIYFSEEAPPNLFKIMKKAFDRGSLVCAAIEPDPNIKEAKTGQGLVKGHAYSLTRVLHVDINTPRVSGKIPLVRIRNPWGNEMEWNGAWSDGSPEWSLIPDHEKDTMGLNFDNDGEFWMSFQDMMKFFNRIEICNLNPDSLEDGVVSKKWELSMFEGDWVSGVTAGGCRNYLSTFVCNPQYNITLEQPDEDSDNCTVIVSLMQKNRRKQRNMGIDHLTIGFVLYFIPDPENTPKPLNKNFFRHNAMVGKSPIFVNLREVSCRFNVPPGTYCIIPSTFEPNEEGEFLIRVFSENKNNLVECDQAIGIIKPSEPDVVKPDIPRVPRSSRLQNFFTEIAGSNEEVEWSGLQKLLQFGLQDELNTVIQKENRNTEASAAPNQTGESNILTELLNLFCGAFCKDSPLADLVPKPEEVPLTSQDAYVEQNTGFSNDICRSLVALLDKNRSGKLNYDEFNALWADIKHWTTVFRTYDRDNSNTLNGYELRDALNSAGFSVNAHTLNMIMHRYGNANHTLDFDDFLMCIIKIKHMIEAFKEKDTDNENVAKFTLEEFIDVTIYS